MKCSFGLIVVLFTSLVQADISPDTPPFSLTIDQLAQWSVNSDLADAANISSVSVQRREAAQLVGKLDANVRVLIAPDGMNNLGNYLVEQPVSNLYSFTYWPYVDVLNWFAGTATQTVNLPARPWVDAAHRNGVKVIGSVFLGPNQWGGRIDTVEKLVQRDSNGHFPMARKLLNIAQYYGFDGWLINQETDLTRITDKSGALLDNEFDVVRAEKLASDVLDFMRYLQSIAPPEIEVHWYDAMIETGKVAWQNELNNKNAVYFQGARDKSERASDGIFINYWWNTSMLEQSHLLAKQLGRSPYDVYTGVDLWPTRTAQPVYKNKDWLHSIFSANNRSALTSIALFASNVNYSFAGAGTTSRFSSFKDDADDVDSFYRAEARFFSGDNMNVAVHDAQENWVGLARYIAAKAVIFELPFTSNFNVGHGRISANKGQLSAQDWHDMSQQDVVPTWQFAVQGNQSLKVAYDFTDAYQGGSSLKIWGDPSQGNAHFPLYQTKIAISRNTIVRLVFKVPEISAPLSFDLDLDGDTLSTDIPSSGDVWQSLTLRLSQYRGKTIRRIGFKVMSNGDKNLRANIGEIYIGESTELE